MNILHVTLGFLPAESWGGPVKIVHENAKALIQRGHQVTVYCTNLLDKRHKIQPGTFEDEIDGIRVVYHNTLNIKQWPGTLGPIYLPGLGRKIRSEISRFDILHLNGYRNLMNLPMIRAARHAGVPLVMQPHGAMPVIINTLVLKKLYDRVFGSYETGAVDAFIALQEAEKAQILAHGVPAEKITIIGNGIQRRKLDRQFLRASFREAWGIPPESKVILFLGRINKKKGTDMLVEAFRQVAGEGVVLVVAGPDDGQLAEVEHLVKQYQLEERVVLTGMLSEESVFASYAAADIFVLPCRTDTYPTTMMEACMMELPMVVTQGCEISHLVENTVGEVTPFDADQFAKALDLLITDEHLYRSFQDHCGRLFAEEFSLNATADKLEALYTRMLAA